MREKLTVEKLIEILTKVEDKTLLVRMSMNNEYDASVSADMVDVVDYGSGPRLYISDTLPWERVDDTTYDENGNIVDLSDTI
jgi:hypothetical protein